VELVVVVRFDGFTVGNGVPVNVAADDTVN
jgi:hypothetical protein